MARRPTSKEYRNLVEVFSSQRKPNFTEAAALVGVDRPVAEQAFKKGWAGDPITGKGALIPIRDILEQEAVTASSFRRQVLERMSVDQKEMLEAAIRDGAMQKALEGVVSSTFLTVIDKQMSSSLKMMSAAQPLVDRLVSQFMTMAREEEVSMVEIQAVLSFIAGYARETAFMFRTYSDVEKIRTTMLPEKPEEKDDVIDPEKLTPKDAVNSLLDMLTALKGALPEKRTGAAAPVVIDVTPQPSSAVSSSSSSSSHISSSSSSSKSSQSDDSSSSSQSSSSSDSSSSSNSSSSSSSSDSSSDSSSSESMSSSSSSGSRKKARLSLKDF